MTSQYVKLIIATLCGLMLISPIPPLHLAYSQGQKSSQLYLPMIVSPHNAYAPFGVETFALASDTVIANYAKQLGPQWIRLNTIAWRDIQPERDGPYNTNALMRLDNELRVAHNANFTPIVTIRRSPTWATINHPKPIACGAIREDRFEDFAKLMGWLAARYKDRVQYWELGNEPDIDPTLVETDAFGCWGDINDPYYGGEHYGKMLKVVAPAIRKANPNAKIIIGGLALDSPNTTDPAAGKPERFFEGILRAGAADSFDIVAFHSYPWFSNRPLDYDYDADFSKHQSGVWKDYGGYTLGKAKFLREVMAKYNVSKPLFLNETALTCVQPPRGPCPGPSPTFDRAQVNFLIRMMARGGAAGIDMISWYMLEGPGWRYSGLLDAEQKPRPIYNAYKVFVEMTSGSLRPVRVYDYDRPDTIVETYRFTKDDMHVDVLWGADLSTYYVKVPPKFIKAYDQFGKEIKPIGPYIPVAFESIYILRGR